MSTDLERLDELKVALSYGEQVADAFGFFHDTFLSDPEFAGAGEAVTEAPAGLMTALEAIGRRGLGVPTEEPVIADLRLARIPARHFVYGTGTLSGYLVTVLLFEDANLGAVAVKRDETKVLYSRFALTPSAAPGATAPPPHWFRRQGRN